VQDIILKADSHSSCQKIGCFLCGTRRSITVLTKSSYWTLFWASQMHFIPSIPVSLRSILMLSSHLRLRLPKGLFPSGLPIKTLQTSFPSPKRATCPAYLILLDIRYSLFTRSKFSPQKFVFKILEKFKGCKWWATCFKSTTDPCQSCEGDPDYAMCSTCTGIDMGIPRCVCDKAHWSDTTGIGFCNCAWILHSN
jgi:hypothetical protein